MNHHNIPYYLIGVNAIALELLKKNIKPGRGTKDIDFAIMISNIGEYEKISKSIENIGFKKVKAPWTFYSEKYNVAIDILPFGEIEEKDTLNFDNRHSDLHVLGFSEVLEDAVEVEIEEKVVNIPPLPGMVLLKLVAWSDRPEERENDLGDILKIIQHYYDVAFDEILEFHYDVFPMEDDFEEIVIASEVLGRKAKIFLDKSERLSQRILKVLKENLSDVSRSQIAKEWARKLNKDMEYTFRILDAFQRGILHS